MKKAIILVVLIALLVSLVILLISGSGRSNSNTNKNISSSPVKNEQTDMTRLSGLVTVNGWLNCLPSKTSSINCVIGLQDAKGNDYGLVDQQGKLLDPVKFSSGSSYTAIGYYINNPASLSNYKIGKTIEISSSFGN